MEVKFFYNFFFFFKSLHRLYPLTGLIHSVLTAAYSQVPSVLAKITCVSHRGQELSATESS